MRFCPGRSSATRAGRGLHERIVANVSPIGETTDGRSTPVFTGRDARRERFFKVSFPDWGNGLMMVSGEAHEARSTGGAVPTGPEEP